MPVNSPIFDPKFFSTIKNFNQKTFLSDLSSGVIVGIVALPLAIAFAIASGVPPQTGLITAVVAGFLISFLGGSRVQIGGPSGALVVVIYGVANSHGLDGVVVASIMAGLMLVGMGLLRAGTVIQFMPYPIVIGFTSGIALIIFTSQIQELLGMSGEGIPLEMTGKWRYYIQNLDQVNLTAMGIGLFTILLILIWPRRLRKLPGSLVAIILTTILVSRLNLPVETIGSKFGVLEGRIPTPSLPGVNLEMLRELLIPAFTIAVLVSIESLLSAIVADGATGYRHRPNTELIANGIGNIVAPIFGGMAGSGALAKTMTNVRNGGKTPMAGMIHAIVLLVLMLSLSNLAAMIPLSALAGILVVVAYNMSEWRSFIGLFKSSRGEVAVLLTTFLLTIFLGLNIALPFGIILALILFARRVMETSELQVLREQVEDDQSYLSDEQEMLGIPRGVEIYQIKGPFFFGIANKFEEAEMEIQEKPRVRIIRMLRVPFIDATGLRNLRSFIEKSQRHNTEIILSGVPEKTLESIKKGGVFCLLGKENVCPDIETSLERARIIMREKSKR
jgi:sulfate permease, SulP family